MKVLTEVSWRSNCVEIIWKGNAVVFRRKERARRFYEVGCSKVKLEQEGEGSCGKVCEEGLPKVKLKQEREESWDGRVGCEQKIHGARWVEVGSCTCCPGLTQARVFLKTRQTRYVDGQSSKWWWARKTLRPRWAKWTQVLCCSISQHSLWKDTAL